jgi:hypothetical protein
MFGAKGYCQLKSIEHCFIGYDKNIDPDGYKLVENYLKRALFLPIHDLAVNNSGFLILVSVENVPPCLVDVRDMSDVARYFLCEEVCGVICPPNLTELQKIGFRMSRLTRKGGYNNLIRNMVIVASLHKGEFNDDFLFTINGDDVYKDYLKDIKL